MNLSRRPLFFAVVAVVCLALTPATPSDLWWVNWATAGVAAFWAIMLGIEELAAQRHSRKREES